MVPYVIIYIVLSGFTVATETDRRSPAKFLVVVYRLYPENQAAEARTLQPLSSAMAEQMPSARHPGCPIIWQFCGMT